jgi:F0F1-type ATP synthase membrane subunit b/b'
MSFIKKSFSLHGHKPYNKIINNNQLHQIEEYNNIIDYSRHQAQNIIDEAQIQANNTIEHANQQAEHILKVTNNNVQSHLQQTQTDIQNMLAAANEQVQDILVNSQQRAAQEVWGKAAQLIEVLEQAHKQFYNNTQDIIQSILASIIKKLTSNLDLQDKMHVLVEQVFAKAKEVEYATLFLNSYDFKHRPEFHIPDTWKIEKDNMLEKGAIRLVGAGGEWKTSIKLIENKMLEAIAYDESKHILLYNEDSKTLDDNDISDKNIDDDNKQLAENYINDNNIDNTTSYSKKPRKPRTKKATKETKQ